MGIARQVFGITPGGRRVNTVGRLGAVFKHGLEISVLVESQIDGLTYLGFIQRWMLAIDGHKRGHEGRGLRYSQRWILGGSCDVQRLGRESNLAFIATQFLQPHVGVRGDGKNQPVNGWLAGKVVRVGLVAHHRVFLETVEYKRPGTYRLAVHQLRCACFHQLVGIFSRVDRGKAHAQRWQEGRIRATQGEAHGQRIRSFNFFDQLRQLQGLRVGKTALRHLVPWVGRVKHAFEAETHVIGIQLTAGGKIRRAVELDPGTQLEIVHKTIRGH